MAVDMLNLAAAARVEDAQWECFQIEMLNNPSRFSIDVKARQIAWSFTAALDAVTDSMLHPGHPYIFVSYKREEAREKIRYVRQIIEALDIHPKSKRVRRANELMVELENGSRFISHPQRPVRGIPQARIYLDEMAHYREGLARQIYLGSLPAITKGGGYMRIGSSPLGGQGLFWEIYSQSLQAYPGFSRHHFPWWRVSAFCRAPGQAAVMAPDMLTAEPVGRFARPALQEIYQNMILEDFQQEYECAWVDEASAWIPWAMIQRNQQKELKYWRASNIDQALALIEPLRDGIHAGKVESTLVGGLDVGRSHDRTEFIAVGITSTGQLPVRLMVSLDGAAFDDQQRCFEELLNRLPFTRVLVDRNGIGAQLAENLERTGHAEGVNFTNPSKELWAVEARIQAERGNTPLPPDRELAYQIHSIRRKLTAAKNNVFDNQRSDRHHADMFWAWALAVYAGGQGVARHENWRALGVVEKYKSRWS